MDIKVAHNLKNQNTFGLDVMVRQYVSFFDEKEISAYLSAHTLMDQKVLVLGGGSNLLFVKDYDGIILHPCLTGIDVLSENSECVRVKVMAGEKWDDFVRLSVKNGWAGIENLSLIPGNVGASAVQNIGAYGVEVKDRIESVTAIDLKTSEKETFLHGQCGFGYRDSHFKSRWQHQYVITSVNYRLQKQPDFTLSYPGVTQEVDIQGGPSLANVRQAIINIRKRKLPDPSDLGNAGSFFKNPLVDDADYARLKNTYPDLPHYPGENGRVKLPAGWLVERSGGKAAAIGRAGVYPKQALVIVNHGGATGMELYALSEKIRSAVYEKFGIDLEREVRVIA